MTPEPRYNSTCSLTSSGTMFPPLSVQHSWSLSDSEGHGPTWYKRVTKRLVQFCRRKRHKFSSKVAAKTKRTFHTSSNNGNDDGEPIGQDMTYKALSLVIKSGYPVGSVLGRGTLHIQQNGKRLSETTLSVLNISLT